jgi:hypothetical protein
MMQSSSARKADGELKLEIETGRIGVRGLADGAPGDRISETGRMLETLRWAGVAIAEHHLGQNDMLNLIHFYDLLE